MHYYQTTWGHNPERRNIVTCFATEDVVRIVNSFYYNLTRRDYNHLLHCYTFTQLTISTL
jgi:hypothetical protein